MQITMAELNKNVNSIINQAYTTGESVTILKHGKPIAQISPITDSLVVENALNYLSTIEPINVEDSIATVINKGRQRGI
jgi:prevent-host-death family protein